MHLIDGQSSPHVAALAGLLEQLLHVALLGTLLYALWVRERPPSFSVRRSCLQPPAIQEWQTRALSEALPMIWTMEYAAGSAGSHLFTCITALSLCPSTVAGSAEGAVRYGLQLGVICRPYLVLLPLINGLPLCCQPPLVYVMVLGRRSSSQDERDIESQPLLHMQARCMRNANISTPCQMHLTHHIQVHVSANVHRV